MTLPRIPTCMNRIKTIQDFVYLPKCSMNESILNKLGCIDWNRKGRKSPHKISIFEFRRLDSPPLIKSVLVLLTNWTLAPEVAGSLLSSTSMMIVCCLFIVNIRLCWERLCRLWWLRPRLRNYLLFVGKVHNRPCTTHGFLSGSVSAAGRLLQYKSYEQKGHKTRGDRPRTALFAR